MKKVGDEIREHQLLNIHAIPVWAVYHLYTLDGNHSSLTSVG